MKLTFVTALPGLQPLSFDFSEWWKCWSGRLAIMQHFRDEAEIRDLRRTYFVSGFGLPAQALSKASRMDPVLLL